MLPAPLSQAAVHLAQEDNVAVPARPIPKTSRFLHATATFLREKMDRFPG
jgi:hypothetical protein